MSYKLLFGAAAAVAGVLAINHFSDDEETVADNSNETVKDDEFADDACYYEQTINTQQPILDNALRRGDRFVCPETGEELQVRAVGGRPKKG